MTQISLPITSRANSDANLFTDVYSNDTAITTVVNGDLRNDNLAAAGTANIALGKLAAGSSAQLPICNASGVPVYKDVTGDVTVSAAGVTAIGALKVVTANIDNSAVITAKINDGAVTSPKLSLTTAADTLAASINTLSTSLTDVCSVNVVVGGTYIVLAQAQLENSVLNGNLRQAHLSLQYNGAEHESGDISFENGEVVHWNLVVTITSVTTLKLRAKNVGSGDINVKGSANSLTRLSAIRIG